MAQNEMELISKAEAFLSAYDYLVFTAVLATSLIIGLYHAFSGGRQKTTEEYFMANHQLRTLPVALSILVSFVSAILVLGLPAEMYTRGTQMIMRLLGYFIAIIFSTTFLVPLFYNLRITSTFEYLDRRFQSKIVRRIGCVMMLLGNVFYMGLLLYTPSTALKATTTIPTWVSILGMGIIATLYTTLGGMKAVIWTDVFQACVMITGMTAVVIVGTIQVGGMSEVLRLSKEGGRLIFFDFNPDPSQRLSFWSLVIGGAFSTVTIFGIGQTSVQRYSALPTLKQAKRSVYLNIPGLLMVNVLAASVGLVVFAYYASKHCDPLEAGFINNSNQLVPYFMLDVLNYPCVPGLFLAVLFSGALSSLSSSLNSAAAVTWEDLMKPYLSTLKEKKKTTITKCLVFLYGTIAVLVSFKTQYLGVHVLQASMSFTGATTGPSLGMFMLGIFTRSANAVGAVVGCMSGVSLSLWLSLGSFITKPYQDTTLPTSSENCNIDNQHTAHLGNLSVYPTDDDLYSLPNVTFSDGNSSSIVDEHSKRSALEYFYGISFLWYSCIGCLTCIVVGYIVSLLTNCFYFKESVRFDEDLIITPHDIPFYHTLEKLFCSKGNSACSKCLKKSLDMTQLKSGSSDENAQLDGNLESVENSSREDVLKL